jgi:hypothetical protein
MNAQTKSISGKYRFLRFPLAGTTILVKGTKSATIADEMGITILKLKKEKH